MHPDLESPVAHTYLGDIVGAQAMVDGEAETLEGVEVVDDRTLRVTITDPFSYFLSKLTYPTSFVVDRANMETGEDWTDAPNGTGAFKLKVWEKDRLLILERNEDWYGGAPALAHVVYRIFAGNPMQMYENGEIDLTGIYVNNIDRARDPANDLNNQLVEGTELCTSYLGFNVSHPPFDDPEGEAGTGSRHGGGQAVGGHIQGVGHARCRFCAPWHVWAQRGVGTFSLRLGDRQATAAGVPIWRGGEPAAHHVLRE